MKIISISKFRRFFIRTFGRYYRIVLVDNLDEYEIIVLGHKIYVGCHYESNNK